ncbi:cell division control protein 6 [[Emmonsia] crescens]|uniref:Cell division control protein n=1 Tax=[Emmonsia] crescens TaxID=73230 RepID=A0A2B7ZN39_9EURO|nr:cell division control protein 6 [Emmonsia crescens]
MASSVLGKRLRNDNGFAIPLRSSKRRAKAPPQPQIHEVEDENDEPSISQNTSCKSRRGLRSLTTTTTKSNPIPIRNVRSKHTVPDKTVDESISPSNATITVSDENTRPIEFTTPKTPSRYRDALLNNTNTNTKSIPVTPRHRVQVSCSGKPLTPRTPRMIASPAAVQTVYTPARQLFARSATPGRLVGRDSERQELAEFVHNAVQSRQGGCMYVSGPPGTGKSATVDEVCHDLSMDIDIEKESVKVAHINCASMTSSKDIYAKLADELCEDPQLFKKSRTELLAGMFLYKNHNTSSAFYLVVLDEIDHLLTTDVETLYTLFEWSLQPHSRLLLIGIANALDLTDRFLPRLKSKNMKPRLLPFLPYTASQIAGIISTRLRSLLPTTTNTTPAVPEDFIPFLHPAAIQLCARKVASQTGDLRKAFDVIRRTIDLIEQETRQKQKSSSCQSSAKTPLVENVNLASPLISPPDTPSSSATATATVYTPATAPRATVAHVARVTASAFGHGTAQRLEGLNLQQKAALCVLITLGRRKQQQQQQQKYSDGNVDWNVMNTPSKSPRLTSTSGAGTAPTVKELFVTYSALCRRDKILQPLAATEFRDVIGSLETLGLVGEVKVQGQGQGRRSTTSGSRPVGTRTPSKPKTPTQMAGAGARADERGLVCFVGEAEVEKHICGEGGGEAILRGLFGAEA